MIQELYRAQESLWAVWENGLYLHLLFDIIDLIGHKEFLFHFNHGPLRVPPPLSACPSKYLDLIALTLYFVQR